MTSVQEWQERNAHFLSQALAWIRLALEAHGQRSTAGQEAEPAGAPPPISDDDLAAQRAAADAAAQAMEPAPPLVQLAGYFRLSRFEQDLLFLCAAMELDTRLPALCAAAQGDPELRYPTFALALSLFPDPAWDVLSPERPLRYWRLLEIIQPQGRPLTSSALHIDERIANYIKGLNYFDDRLAALVTPIEQSVEDLHLPSQRPAITQVIQALRQHAGERPPVLQLVGADQASKHAVALAVATELGIHLHSLPATLLPSGANDLDTTARLWQRETALLPIALYLDAANTELVPDTQGAMARFLDRIGGVVFIDALQLPAALRRPAITIDVSKPRVMEQEAAWSLYLGPAGAASAGPLARQFDFSLAAIRTIATSGLLEPEQLWEACLARSRAGLESLARRIDPRATWDSIVLPEQEMTMLRQLADQVRRRSLVYDTWGFRARMNRGLGISSLFAGDSGTGKTMAAEVLANELHLNLYLVDLSHVVSKYIGETEKNLRQLFDAAEDGGTILFFDEAEALAGKRSEVKDSHDRYANIEIAYLLQRMEAFSGLAILATNMKNALDPAFVRRLRFIVNFPQPGQVERRGIWEKVFPHATPLADLDLDYLARLPLAGGSIQSIAINAAFLAGSSTGRITMPILLDAARAEYRKLARPINEADFRWDEPAGAAA
ncbi:MAG: AAA family ATPase [Cyanobacteria bacterium 13_1_40CM_2_61_4]|nr:MAG: AAA family ATPase [Cyanobacteria bacterium 13_1_40CM_2_61_4]